MMLKGRTSRTFLYTTFLLVDISLFTQLIGFYPTGNVRGRHISPVHAYISTSVASDEPEIVQNVYVENTLALPVVQQPDGDTNYVSPDYDVVTQFSTVSEYGNIGLLAHNYLSGKAFARLTVGQEVGLTFSSGKTETFVITEILRYQALEPKNPYSSFQNLSNQREIVSVAQVFDRVYSGDYHVTFQTCIANNGISSWGRLFIVAEPKPGQPVLESRGQQIHISGSRP